MEHDDRFKIKRSEDLEDLLGVDKDNVDFQNYLNRKVKDICSNQSIEKGEDILGALNPTDTPTQESKMNGARIEVKLEKQTDTLTAKTITSITLRNDPTKTKNALDAADKLKSAVELAMEEAEEVDSWSNVDAVEKKNILVVKSKPIVGSTEEEKYVAEIVEPATIDSEWKKVFVVTHAFAVSDMTAEQIIELRNELDRTVFLIRAKQGGLKLALEQLLKTTSNVERNRLLDLDKKYKRQAIKRASDPEREKTKRSEPGKQTGKSKMAKGIDAMIGLKMTKEAIEHRLKTSNMLDAAAQTYIDKCFPGE